MPGAVPDMKAQSADYIQLQNIYKAKARKDLSEVVDKVRATESGLMKDKSIDEREIEAFCKGAASVNLIQGRPIKISKHPAKVDWGDRAKSLVQELNDETSLFALYICILAYDNVGSERATAKSGSIALSDIEDDYMAYCGHTISRLKSQSGIEIDLQATMKIMQRFIWELERAAGGELHNISALTGGMVAQEVIKVITKQYVPLDNTCVFDGVTSKVGVFRV